jgi:hypothetical protein
MQIITFSTLFCGELFTKKNKNIHKENKKGKRT